MSRVDVRELAREKLPAGKFPVDSRSDFRLYIAPEVRSGVDEHAKADVSVEICGVIVGEWGTDEDGPFAAVTNYIRCENAASKFAEVTFTHESWAQINKEMDSKYADKRIIGWYHSHPDFGIFLSERDAFIQEHFFSGPGQVAFVVDPVRDLEGVFAWRDGKPTPMAHYWVGNRVRTVEATERSASGAMSKKHDAAAAAGGQVGQSSWDSSPLGLATLALGALCLLLLGYMYGSWRSRAEEEYKRAEAVDQIANLELIRNEVTLQLAMVAKKIGVASEALGNLPEPDAKLSKEELENTGKQREAIRQLLKQGGQDLGRVIDLADAERNIYGRIIMTKMVDIEEMVKATNERIVKAREEQKAAAEKKAAEASAAPKAVGPGSAAAPKEGATAPKNSTPAPSARAPAGGEIQKDQAGPTK